MRYNKLLWISIFLMLFVVPTLAIAVTDYSDLDVYFTMDNDERTGDTITDIIGGTYTLVGESGVSWTTGLIEEALDVDATEEATIAYNANLDLDDSASWVMSMWFKSDSVGASNWWFFDTSSASLSDGTFCFIDGGSTDVRCKVANSFNLQGGTIVAGTWHFVVWQYNMTNDYMELWVDGVNEGNATVSAHSWGNTGATHIGDRYDSVAGFAGLIDEVVIARDAQYTKEMIVESYNSGAGLRPTFGAPPVVTANFSLDTRYTVGGFANQTYINITYKNGTTIQAKNYTGYVIYTNETLNASLYTNLTIRANHTFVKNFINYNFSGNLQANLTSYPYLKIRDSYNNQTISNGTVYISSVNYTTDAYGRSYVPFNSTKSVLVHAPYYWGDGDTLSLDLTTNQNIQLFQAHVRPSITNRVSNTAVSSPRFTAGTQTDVDNNLYLQANTYTVNFYKADYFSQSSPVTTTGKYNASLAFTNATNALATITANDLTNGGGVSNFTAYVTNLAYNFNISHTTTNGSTYFYIEQGIPFNITIDAPNYSWGYSSTTPSQQNTSIAINLYSTNSINFTFIDELLGTPVLKNVTVELIGSVASYNFTDNSGFHYIDLITPNSYTVRYSADGYLQGFHLLTVTDRSAQNVSLYLLNESSGENVTINVIDQSNNYLQGAVVKVLKYDVDSNSYFTTQVVQTNFEGQAQANIVLNSEFYKFVIEYPANTIVEETTATYIYADELTFTVVIGSLTGQIYKAAQNMTYSLSFNANNQFRVSYSSLDNSIDQICAQVYRYSNSAGKTLTNTTCSTSQTGILYAGTNNVSGTTVIMDLLVRIDGEYYFIDSLTKEFGKKDVFGKMGIVLIAIMTIFLFMIGMRNPVIAFILMPLPLVFGSLTGIIVIPLSITFAIVALAIAAILIISRRT